MKHIIALVMAFFLGALPSTSLAAPVTFSFSGKVTESNLPMVAVGTDYSGTFIVDFDLAVPGFQEHGELTPLVPTFVGGSLMVGTTSLVFYKDATFYGPDLYVAFKSVDENGQFDELYFAPLPVPDAPYSFTLGDGYVPSYFSSGLWVQEVGLWYTSSLDPNMAWGQSAPSASVPEPASFGLFAGLVALALLVAVRRRKGHA